MSLPLKEFRGKITVEADAVISTLAEREGQEKQEIVRDILHQWALEKINEARLIGQYLEREGLEGILKERRGAHRSP